MNRRLGGGVAVVLVISLGLALASCRKPVKTPPDDPASSAPPTVEQEQLVLPSVTGDSGGAWAQIERVFPASEDPTTCFFADFHAQSGETTASITGELVTAGEHNLLVWLDSQRLLVRSKYIVDFDNQGRVTQLEVPASSARLSPDKRRIAYWGSGDEFGDGCGVAVMDLEGLSTAVISSFPSSKEAWGTAESEIGVGPRLSWLGDSTLVFDGPFEKHPAIYEYDLASGEISLFQDRAWAVQTSPQGKYAAFMLWDSWGSQPDPNLYIRVLGRDGLTPVPITCSPYDCSVYFDDASGTIAIAERSRMVLGVVRDSAFKILASEELEGLALQVRVEANQVSFVVLVKTSDGVPDALTERTLTTPGGG